MKHGELIRTGALGLLGCAAVGVAFQAGRHHPVTVVREVEKETAAAEAPVAVPVPVPVPVAVPFAIEVRGRAHEALESPALSTVPADEGVEVDPDVCVQNGTDGSRVMWIRTKDRTGITKYDFAADGALSFLTNMRMDPQGNPLSAKVYDGQNELLYKASYGYRRTDGALVAEVLFDPRAAPPGPGKRQVPVRRVTYATGEHAGQVEDIQQDPALAQDGSQPLPAPFDSMVFPYGK